MATTPASLYHLALARPVTPDLFLQLVFLIFFCLFSPVVHQESKSFASLLLHLLS
jgi:hypothetical protein